MRLGRGGVKQRWLGLLWAVKREAEAREEPRKGQAEGRENMGEQLGYGGAEIRKLEGTEECGRRGCE